MKYNKKFGINHIAQAINDYEAEDTLRKYIDRLIMRLEQRKYIEYVDAYTETQKDRIASLIRRLRNCNLKVGKIFYKILDADIKLTVVEVTIVLQELIELVKEHELDISDNELNISLSNRDIIQEIQRIIKRVCVKIIN